MPGMPVGLLSVQQMTNSGLSVHFEPDKLCTILRNGEFIASTIVLDGPYELDIKQPKLALATHETVSAPLMLWHRRFGHPSPQTIINMARSGAVQGLVLSDKLIRDCLHCVLAKSKRSPFTIKATIATEILKRVCIDLGFVPEPDHQGRTVYLAIVDQHSCGRWVFPLSSKLSEGVIEAFNMFRTSVENMTGKKIRFVRSDNGGEFTSKMFETYFKTNGIIHERTAPYTPENNGQVERLNGSIMTTVKAMLHDANLPKTFWSYAMQAAVYLSNRTTVACLNRVTPYKIIFGKKPRVSHIKPFGAVAFVHIDGTLRTKLDDKAVEGILVGFNNYDYVVWLKDQQKEVRTRHATFGRRKHHLLETSELVTDFEVPPISEISEKDSTVTPAEKEVPQQLVPVPDGYIQVQNGYQPGKYGELDMSNIIPYKHRQALFAGPALDSSSSNLQFIRIDDVLPQIDGKWGKTYLCVSVPQGHFIPKTYEEAIPCPDAKFWIIAIREELGALENHNVFEVSFLPDGAIALGSRWVFTIKLDAAGRIIHFKDRLVAQGFAQRPGIDFHETFAPVARMLTIRFLVALAIARSLKLVQFDFDTAFLNGKMTDDVYMRVPKGWTGVIKPGQCLKLIASMYGTKQAPREWNRTLDQLMVEKKWTKCLSDVCLYFKQVGSKYIIVAFYVDDGLFKRDAGYCIVHQSRYITDILARFGFASSKPKTTPMIDCEARELDSLPLIKDVHLYQSMVAYSDASWANNFETRRSVGAYVRLLGGAAISWQSKQQTLVATSTTESEILAVLSATKEVIWLHQVAKDLSVEQPSATTIYEDNQATIKITYNPAHHARTKHFDVVHHFVRERVTLGDIKLVYCPTNSMMANVLTKGLGPIKFAAHRKAMGMVQLSKL
ncbi:BQ5605_C033g11174 [Microbotryum silenes-dioicae]|uniref:BQ5605_C033g11174 protein n=1 Tax=Microbotryum silenes-dioicae TaxID=796604 RepID=A0A2X0MKF1_9BASI|nr:BQ5605_C033g11174 [Microbotryum silenes-dioicae]